MRQAPGNSRAEDGFAVAHNGQGTCYLGLVCSFEEVTTRARTHRREYRIVVFKHGEDQNANMGARVENSTGGFDPIQSWHVHIHQNDIWLERRRLSDSLLSGGHFPYNFSFGHSREQSTQAVTEERMIIGDEYTKRFHRLLLCQR